MRKIARLKYGFLFSEKQIKMKKIEKRKSKPHANRSP